MNLMAFREETKKLTQSIGAWLNREPRLADTLCLVLIILVISFPIYLFHHEIIYLDQGLYLPGIDAILDGQIPQKDFIFYRGPFEIYAPALMMRALGTNMIWLPVFFYAGTMMNIILFILLGRELLRTRFVYILMSFVVLARTFPRISFYYWGGMRYALGIAGVYCVIKFLKTRKCAWLLASGVASAAGFFTTIESGFSAAVSVGAALIVARIGHVIDVKEFKAAEKWFFAGVALVTLPFLVYLGVHKALMPMLEATILFPLRMMTTYLDMGTHIPASFGHFLISLWPGSPYFKVLTPVFLFTAFVGYMVVRFRQRREHGLELALLTALGTYALILYSASFRAIWGHHFEMALQPEKLIYFYLIEILYCETIAWYRQRRIIWTAVKRRMALGVISFLIFALFMSSMGYSLTRFSRHFVVYKRFLDWVESRPSGDYSILHGQDTKELNIERAKGMVVPAWQAEDIEETVRFIRSKTSPDEAVLTYPELGALNFFFDRPFVSRFPIATLSWADDAWHREYLNDIKMKRTRFAVMTNLGHRTFPSQLYFKFPRNIVKFKEVTEYILKHYDPVKRLGSLTIYERRDN